MLSIMNHPVFGRTCTAVHCCICHSVLIDVRQDSITRIVRRTTIISGRLLWMRTRSRTTVSQRNICHHSNGSTKLPVLVPRVRTSRSSHASTITMPMTRLSELMSSRVQPFHFVWFVVGRSRRGMRGPDANTQAQSRAPCCGPVAHTSPLHETPGFMWSSTPLMQIVRMRTPRPESCDNGCRSPHRPHDVHGCHAGRQQ
ncbi:hypothetical protein K461DRAFT_179431 [Myriangium duriaei CBS 260.36]|uniref:Uncharacterized protein n=1 Tax=Myriangium duriaei CBS 260.36 TaxID=1168546 RepID=A0A9P4MI49_9PEZI|nr:hypothetical protein K461DRAFT_179431 [Myriangium duriaei CBS 260.36]